MHTVVCVTQARASCHCSCLSCSRPARAKGSLPASCGMHLAPPLSLQKSQLLSPLRLPELQQPCSCCGQPWGLGWRHWNFPGLASCCLGFQQALPCCWVSNWAQRLRTWSAGQAYRSGHASCRAPWAPLSQTQARSWPLPGRVLCQNGSRHGRLQQDVFNCTGPFWRQSSSRASLAAASTWAPVS